MPPHFPVEDTAFETKQWASATIDTLFSDNNPISFEPHKASLVRSTISPARRSVSVLETNVFNRLPHDNKVRTWATTTSSSQSPLSYSGSAPSLLIPNNQVSLSARLKRSLTPDKLYLNKKHLSYKEKEGVDIWKNTFQQYLNETKMVKNPFFFLGIVIHADSHTHTLFVFPIYQLPHGQSPHLLHFILNELMTTEITYLEHLLIIKQV